MICVPAAGPASGAPVLVGDPGRAFLPPGACTIAAEYDVPTSEALESVAVKRTAVWRIP